MKIPAPQWFSSLKELAQITAISNIDFKSQKISKEIKDWRKANNWKTMGKNEQSIHFIIPE